MNAVAWVGSLFLLGMAVLVLEVFVPSGGVLGFVSLAAFVASIAIAYTELGAGAGTAMLGLAVAAVPVVLGLAFRWFPDTPLGKRVLPPPPEAEDVVPDRGRGRARALVGRAGRAEVDLLPWGRVTIEGESLEAMSDEGPIDAGTAVVVAGVQGAALVVRRRPAVDPPGDGSREEGKRARDVASPAEGPSPDRLSPTLESFTFESLDSPGA